MITHTLAELLAMDRADVERIATENSVHFGPRTSKKKLADMIDLRRVQDIREAEKRKHICDIF